MIKMVYASWSVVVGSDVRIAAYSRHQVDKYDTSHRQSRTPRNAWSGGLLGWSPAG